MALSRRGSKHVPLARMLSSELTEPVVRECETHKGLVRKREANNFGKFTKQLLMFGCVHLWLRGKAGAKTVEEVALEMSE